MKKENQTEDKNAESGYTLLGGVDGYDLNAIISVEKQITELQCLKAEKLKLYGVNNCPYKIGDVVDILGFAHVGKKGRINFINGTFKTHVYDKSNSLGWYVKGVVLKKDGTDSQHTFDSNDWHYGNMMRDKHRQ